MTAESPHRTDPAGSAGSEATLRIPRRFRGPATSGNGGFVAGTVASFLPEAYAVSVTLVKPPPLETDLTVMRGEMGVRLFAGEEMIADGIGGGQLDVDPLAAVTFEEALEAGERYAGLTVHPFPECFACGVDRTATGEDSGLRLRPGPLDGRPDEVAAAWVPDVSLAEVDEQAMTGGIPETPEEGAAGAREPGAGAVAAAEQDDAAAGGRFVPAEIVWAALDCPGGWSVDLVGRPMVLGRMTAHVTHLPRIGGQYVVVGKVLGRERRKAFTESTLLDRAGRPLAVATATWIEVDPSRIGAR